MRETRTEGPKAPGNGGAHLRPSRANGGTTWLNEDEAKRLSRYLAHADARAVRASLGVAPELAAAIAARRDGVPVESFAIQSRRLVPNADGL